MCETNCPRWESETREQIVSIVAGLQEFYRFIIKACKTQYLLNHGDIKTFHGKVFANAAPVPFYAGNYRGKNHQHACLAQLVAVNGILGAHYEIVQDAMRQFSDTLKAQTIATDDFVKRHKAPTERAKATAQLAAVTMAELIRIHPFINGNGRMARMVANFICKRYGFPMPFRESQLRPPEGEYAAASAKCMGSSSDPIPMYLYLLALMSRDSILRAT